MIEKGSKIERLDVVLKDWTRERSNPAAIGLREKIEKGTVSEGNLHFAAQNFDSLSASLAKKVAQTILDQPHPHKSDLERIITGLGEIKENWEPFRVMGLRPLRWRAWQQLAEQEPDYISLLHILLHAKYLDPKLKKEVQERFDHQRRELKGDTISLGRAIGRANILQKPEDAEKRLKGNEVVILPNLLPEWERILPFSPLAVVAGEGGLLAHLGIIFREWRIPCVMIDVVDAMPFLIHNKELIEVDATQEQGIVRILKPIKERIAYSLGSIYL